MKKVLIIDDDQGVIDSLEAIFSHMGYKPLAASTYEKAHEILTQEEDVPLVIQDMVLPDMTGIEMYNKLKEDFPKARFVAHTGDVGNVTTAKDAMSLGFYDYIGKPSSAEVWDNIMKRIEKEEGLEDIVKKEASHNLLVVDTVSNSEKQDLYGFKGDLESMGYGISFTDSGVDALRKVTDDKKSIDLVVMDLNTTDIEGIELIKKIKDLRPDIQVITYTGTGSGSAKQVMNAGAFDYVTKPAERVVILDSIDKALKHKQFTMDNIKNSKKKLFPEEEASEEPRDILYLEKDRALIEGKVQKFNKKERNNFISFRNEEGLYNHIKSIKPMSKEAGAAVVLGYESISLTEKIAELETALPVISVLADYRSESIADSILNGAVHCIPASASKLESSIDSVFEAHKVKYAAGAAGKEMDFKKALSKIKKANFIVIEDDPEKRQTLDRLLTQENFNVFSMDFPAFRKIQDKMYSPDYVLFNPTQIYSDVKDEDKVYESMIRGFHIKSASKNTRLIAKGDVESIPDPISNLINTKHIDFIPENINDTELISSLLALMVEDVTDETTAPMKTDNAVYVITGATSVGKDSVANDMIKQDKDHGKKHDFEKMSNIKKRRPRITEKQTPLYERITRQTEIDKYHYKVYGDHAYINPAIYEKLISGKNVILTCGYDAIDRLAEFMIDKDLPQSIVTILLGANEDSIKERLMGDATRSPEEVKYRLKNLDLEKYTLNDVADKIDLVVPTDGVSPRESAKQILDQIEHIKEHGSLDYHKRYVDRIVKGLMPLANHNELKDHFSYGLSSQTPLELRFNELVYREYLSQVDDAAIYSFAGRNITTFSEKNGVLGIYLDSDFSTQDTKKHLIELLTRQFGEPTLSDEANKFYSISNYAKSQAQDKESGKVIGISNIASYASSPEAAKYSKILGVPTTISFVMLDRCEKKNVEIITDQSRIIK